MTIPIRICGVMCIQYFHMCLTVYKPSLQRESGIVNGLIVNSTKRLSNTNHTMSNICIKSQKVFVRLSSKRNNDFYLSYTHSIFFHLGSIHPVSRHNCIFMRL